MLLSTRSGAFDLTSEPEEIVTKCHVGNLISDFASSDFYIDRLLVP